MHTRWIETEWDNTVEPFADGAETEDVPERQSVVVEVGGGRLEVSLPAGLGGAPAARRRRERRLPGRGGGSGSAAASGDA